MKTIRVTFLQTFGMTKTDLPSLALGNLLRIHYYFQKEENTKLDM